MVLLCRSLSIMGPGRGLLTLCKVVCAASVLLPLVAAVEAVQHCWKTT